MVNYFMISAWKAHFLPHIAKCTAVCFTFKLPGSKFKSELKSTRVQILCVWPARPPSFPNFVVGNTLKGKITPLWAK